MKKIIILLFLFNTMTLMAQETNPSLVKKNFNVLTTTPLGYYNKARLTYQRNLYNGITAGIIGAYYYNFIGIEEKNLLTNATGIKAELFFRFYTGMKELQGFYVQVKGGYLNMNVKYQIVIDESELPSGFSVSSNNELGVQERISAFGGGFAMGNQWLIGGNKRFVIDFCYLNIQYYPFNYSKFESGPFQFQPNTSSQVYWYLYGPAAIINPTLSLGYRF